MNGLRAWRRRSVWLASAAVAAALLVPPSIGQVPPAVPLPTQPSTLLAAAAEPMVAMNLPENAPLKILLEYVSQEFGQNILYDEQAAAQRVTIKAPARIPKRAVPGLLDGALRMRGLALADADQPGFKRVVPLAQAARVAQQPPATGPAAPAGEPAAAVVSHVFRLQFADAKGLDVVVKSFLTTPGGSSFALPEQAMLVVTDYASNVRRVEELVRSVDRPNQDVTIEFLPLRHADPARLTRQVEQLLRAKLRTQGGGEGAEAAVEATYDARTNQIVLIAPRDRVEDARQIVKALDTAVAEEQSPVRFYKLANTTAVDVLATIRGLEEDDEPAAAGDPGRTPGGGSSPTLSPRGSDSVPLPGVPLSTGGGAFGNRSADSGATDLGGGGGSRTLTPAAPIGASGGSSSADSRGLSGRYGNDTAASRSPAVGGSSRGAGQVATAVRTRQARVAADPHTNSIIVIGPPDVQRLYEQLIRTLDKRRPQVLVECTIVTLDTTGNFSLGVEIGRRGGIDNSQVVTFSSFGLSTPDPVTGRLRLLPGLGFNGALVSTDVADVVIRALAQDTRARVTSAPRILVNDNNVGTLSSIAEFPYASVNASDTVATTSFGDYVQAGTEITVTPHISESDYLQLEYAVSLSSFTGQPVTQSGATLPPPRKSDSVQSQVTIPDGSTIIVGGLNRRNMTETVDRIPLLGRIPVLGYLFSSRTKTDGNTTLFVFIRPIILRDDKFADLKFMSEQGAAAAEVPGDYPASEPLTVR